MALEHIWHDKHGTKINNGDIINSPQGKNLPIIYMEKWDDLGIVLAIFIRPLNRDWEKYYEIVGRGNPRTIIDTDRIDNMPEYKRDFGKTPLDKIKEIDV